MDRRSIGFHIDELAHTTEAPAAFVEQIRAIFTRRGVSLDQDVLPYLEILEETFMRVAMLQKDNDSARDGLARLEENSRRFADSCLELYGQLRYVDDFLRGPGRSPEESEKRRQRVRERAAARRKAANAPARPFFVILTPSDPE